MKVFSPHDFAALVGIDWADKKHDICEYSMTDKRYLHSVISSQPAAIHAWANDLKKRFPRRSIAVSCELCKGPLIYALSQYDHIVLFPINPITVAKYRKAFTPSGAKDDPSDAKIQTELLLLHMNRFTPLVPESVAIRSLAQLNENRRKLVSDQVRMTNRLAATLKNYYPQVLDWFTQTNTIVCCDFIRKWPTLKSVQGARKATLERFFHQHNVRGAVRIAQRIDVIQTAVSLTDDEGVIMPNQLLAVSLVQQIRVLIESIKDHEQQISTIYKSAGDFEIFDSLPGAGAVFGPRLMAAFGENRDRYPDAQALQCYGGIAPVLKRSGQQSWTHWRYSSPTFLRQSFVEWAGESVRYSFWAKAYYQQQKEKGKPHQTIIRALAYKWIRIIFRCWQDGKPYDESTYLSALKKRHSPLLEYAAMS